MTTGRFPHTFVTCFAISLCAVFLGCSDTFSPCACDPVQEIQLRRDSVEKTIEYVQLAWRHKLYPEYELVLHDQYEFFPLERDVQDFPWMTGASWSRIQELSIAVHMFDPDFSGEQSPVDVIEIDLTELSRRDLGTNYVEVTCMMVGRVLNAANDGWSFDTRVLIEIVPDPDEPGLFQVIKQTEIDAV